MSRKVTLPQLLKKFYAENSRFDAGPPVQVLKELENNILVLADIEISDDDIPVLARFFNHPQTCKQIKRIHVDRSSSRKAHVRRLDSSFTANGCRLLRELFKFIGNAKSLQCVCFESVEMPIEALPLLGKALVSTTSPICWLGFKDCDIQGDAGLRILTHYIGQLKLQVLAIEQCGLTDNSLVYIASILKAQHNNLDSLYWNATLRVDPNKRGTLWNASEIDSVYRCGLVALSLFGNNFQGKDIYVLTRVLRNNHWLLGLNLANNNIGRENMLILTEELLNNKVMQVILLKNNPGIDQHIASIMHAAILRNTSDTVVDVTQDVVEHLKIRHSSGPRRVDMQLPRIALLLRTWQQLQATETIAPQVPKLPSKHQCNMSTTSAATLGSTSLSVVSPGSAGVRAASLRSNGIVKKKALTPGTRRAAEAELVHHLSSPHGYSALDIVNDHTTSAPYSPRRRPASPAFRAGNVSFSSMLSSSFATNAAANVSNLAEEPSDRLRYLLHQNEVHRNFDSMDPAVAVTTRRIIDTFHLQASLEPDDKAEALCNEQHHQHHSGTDSIQLSDDSQDMGVIDGSMAGQDAKNNETGSERDVLELAVPMVSPVKGTITAEPLPSSNGEFYIGMRSVESGTRRDHNSSSNKAEAELEDWGIVDWPVSDDAMDHLNSTNQEGRPPSRISIRHRGGSGSPVITRSPSSPTQDMLLQHKSLDEEYRRLLAHVKGTQRPPRQEHNTSRLSHPANSSNRPSAPLRSSRDRDVSLSSSKPFPPTRPFYAGGSIPGASPPRPVQSTISNAEMAALYGPGRGIGRPDANAWGSYDRSHSLPRARKTRKKKVTKRPKHSEVSFRPSSSTYGASLGRAYGVSTSTTRIRSRSAERSQERRRSSPSIRATSTTFARPTEASNASLANELSSTVLNATRNLESVSEKLRDVIDTLSTSMDMNFSMQRELLSASMLNASAVGSGHGMNTSTSHVAWSSPATHFSSTTPVSYMKGRGGPPDSARSSTAAVPAEMSPSRTTAAQRYRDASPSPAPASIPVPVPVPYAASTAPPPSYHSNGHHRSEGSAPPAPVADPALVDLVRSRMEIKLRSLLEA